MHDTDSSLVLLKGATVFAPEPMGRRSLLIGGGTILWIGADAPALPRGLDCDTIDLAGRRLIPGLIDGHAHITGGGGEDGFRSRVPAPAPSRYTRSGITSVVGLLGTDDTMRNTESLVAGTLGLREEGLSAWCYCGGYHLPPVTLTGSVRRDIACVDPIIGVGELALSDHRSSQPTLNELLRVAADAHVAGMMSGKAGVVHLHLGDGPRGLALVREALAASELPPRVFHPTHVNRRRALFDEALQLAESGCCIDVTAFPVADGEDGWPADVALRRYFNSGLPPARITISSDGGGCLPHFDADGRIERFGVGDPGALAECLAALLAAGVAPEQALPPFTSNPAMHLRLPRKGRIAIGADADLVALGEDGMPQDVMARGRWHLREGQILRRGLFEQSTEEPLT